MKTILKSGFLKIYLMVMSVAISLFAMAQDKKLDVDVSIGKESANWYMQPWVWVLGGAIFILLLAAILRGNKSK